MLAAFCSRRLVALNSNRRNRRTDRSVSMIMLATLRDGLATCQPRAEDRREGPIAPEAGPTAPSGDRPPARARDARASVSASVRARFRSAAASCSSLEASLRRARLAVARSRPREYSAALMTRCSLVRLVVAARPLQTSSRWRATTGRWRSASAPRRRSSVFATERHRSACMIFTVA